MTRFSRPHPMAILVVLFTFMIELSHSFCPNLASSSFSVSRLSAAASVCATGPKHREAGIFGKTGKSGRAVQHCRPAWRCSSDATADSESLPIPDKRRENFAFVLRRGRPHELDLLAILSTEAFTPQGAWYDVVQRLKHTLTVWDLQAQFYQRYYQWPEIVKEFRPPIEEARYALLVAATPEGAAIGMTELCVCPSPVPVDVKQALEIGDVALYVSNLAVAAEHRRKGVGEGLVRWCEELGREWGQTHVLLHVERDNLSAIAFYKALGFTKVTRCIEWYARIRRADLAAQNTIVLFKALDADAAAADRDGSSGEQPLAS